MAQYALVKDNVITNLYDSIPMSFGNEISGFHLMTDEERQEYGFMKVIQADLSGYDPQIHVITSDTHQINSDGLPERIFTYVDRFTPEELLENKKNEFWNRIRDQRNALLTMCDWTLMPDVVAVKGQEWVDAWSSYRQELRDMTLNTGLYDDCFGEPNNVQFPNEPNL